MCCTMDYSRVVHGCNNSVVQFDSSLTLVVLERGQTVQLFEVKLSSASIKRKLHNILIFGITYYFPGTVSAHGNVDSHNLLL